MSKLIKISPKKVSVDNLEILRKAKEDAMESAAIAKENDLVYQRLVMQAIRRAEAPIEGSILCLDCGEIRRDREHTCPDSDT